MKTYLTLIKTYLKFEVANMLEFGKKKKSKRPEMLNNHSPTNDDNIQASYYI